MPNLDKIKNLVSVNWLSSYSKITSVFPSGRKSRLLSFSAFFLALFAIGAAGVVPLAPDPADIPVKRVIEQLPFPSIADQVVALEQDNQQFIHEERVRRGDTLGSLLQRLGVDDNDAAAFIKSNATARLVMQQRAGRTVRAQTDDQGQLQWLQTTMQDGGRSGNVATNASSHAEQVSTITVSRKADTDTFVVSNASTALEKRVEMHTGTIYSSLFAATDAAQIPDAVASQLVEMFSTNIDFASDLRRGDNFQVVYETFWQNGEMIRTGRVLAGEFTNAGKSYQAVWFDESADSGSYYGFDGKSMKKAFLRSPLAFTRISSGFSMRLHPISGLWKQHTGVDFAAPTGTPIRASADGEVASVGVAGGYGNMVMLRHWSGYSTVYGHMSRFAPGLRKGAKVRQGDVIGFVGQTGWATGPHLHYEFRVNNVAIDPMKVKVNQAVALSQDDLLRFKNVSTDMHHRFALLRPDDVANAPALVASAH